MNDHDDNATNPDFQALDRIAQACWQTAEDKGWHQESSRLNRLNALYNEAKDRGVSEDLLKPFEDLLRTLDLTSGTNLPEKLMLIVSEVGEAMEAYRHPHWLPTETYYKDKTSVMGYRHASDPLFQGGKPEGVGSELADVVIRVFDLAKEAGIDITAEIERKMEYNASREFRHGGKRA